MLVTTFNRKELTLNFLASLEKSMRNSSIELDVIVIDDNSSDGTVLEINKSFPSVKIIRGTGFLYWSTSLRLAFFELGRDLENYDGIFFANDDIEVLDRAVDEIVEVAHRLNALVGGPVRTKTGDVEATGYRFGYVCRPKFRRILPNGSIRDCDVLPGHLLYMPIDIYSRIAVVGEVFSHGFTDFELSLNARNLGIRRVALGRYVGVIDKKHNYFREQAGVRLPVRQIIWRLRFNPKSPPIHEAVHYLRRVSKLMWPIWLIGFYLPHLISFIQSLFTIDIKRLISKYFLNKELKI